MSGKNDGTGAGLVEFLDWAGRTGEMAANTASAWAAVVRQVLAIDGDWESVDVRTIDPDAFFERFEVLNRTRYSSGSMATYRSRFRSAIQAYGAWLNNEPWKPAKRAVKPTNKKAASPKAAATAAPDSQPTAPIEPTPHAVGRLLNYTVPLRPDLIVTLNLPADLTRADADRISNFVRSLAFEPEPSRVHPAGHETSEGA